MLLSLLENLAENIAFSWVILISKAESTCLWAPKFEQIRPQNLGMKFNGEKTPTT